EADGGLRAIDRRRAFRSRGRRADASLLRAAGAAARSCQSVPARARPAGRDDSRRRPARPLDESEHVRRVRGCDSGGSGSMMSPEEQILVALQDLDLMLKEAVDSREQFRQMGFDVAGVPELRKARAHLVGQLEMAHLQHYEKMQQRYGRAVFPVT